MAAYEIRVQIQTAGWFKGADLAQIRRDVARAANQPVRGVNYVTVDGDLYVPALDVVEGEEWLEGVD